jgi:hypothetical protein
MATQQVINPFGASVKRKGDRFAIPANRCSKRIPNKRARLLVSADSKVSRMPTRYGWI